MQALKLQTESPQLLISEHLLSQEGKQSVPEVKLVADFQDHPGSDRQGQEAVPTANWVNWC